MGYKRYKMLQKYINGEVQEEYKQGELISSTVFSTLEACNEGNQRPDEPIEGDIYQWVTVSGEYLCNEYDKYTKEKEQSSSDRGVSWTDTGRTRQGSLIEANSSDCGYIPPGPQPPSEYDGQYFTIQSLQDGNDIYMIPPETNHKTVQVSMNGGFSWTSVLLVDVNDGTLLGTLNNGGLMLVKATGRLGDSSNSYSFKTTKQFNVFGNILSLTNGDDFVGDVAVNYDYEFRRLFKNCTGLISAENLVLPSVLQRSAFWAMFTGCTSLVNAPQLTATRMQYGCYQSMFNGCTSLVNAPALPATTLASSCYNGMFQGCTSLVNAPALTATTLATYCYSHMFYGCTSLVNAPQLPATTLTDSCYSQMFVNCTSLTTAPALPATTLANNCYYNMFQRCTSLVNAPSILPATTLADNCYQYMFQGCTSLTTAPVLPATTLTQRCYYYMFQNCTSLNYVKMLGISEQPNSLSNWLYNVSASGTAVLNSNTEIWTSDVIPSGWNIQYE